MKNLAVLCVLLAALCVGCGGGDENQEVRAIKDTLKGYVTTYNAGDFPRCLTHFTDYGDEDEALAFLSFMRGMAGELKLSEIKDISISTPTTATATVVFTIAGEPGTDQMHLRKVGGQWKIVWAEESPGPTPTQEPPSYTPIPMEGCLPSAVEVAPELQGEVQVNHCLWSDEEGQLWEAYQVLNVGDRALDLCAELYVYDSEGQELLLESSCGAAGGPGQCWGYCGGGRGAAPLTTTRYRMVVRPW